MDSPECLWSSSEFTVDPRQIIQSLPVFLEERYGVEFVFSTAVTAIDHPGCIPEMASGMRKQCWLQRRRF